MFEQNKSEQNKQNWSNILLSFALLLLAFVVIAVVNRITMPQQPEQEIELIDNDNDGYYTITIRDKRMDCKDDDDTIHPGALEIEGDGIDQDCDGYDKLPDFDPDQYKEDLVEFNKFWSLKNNPSRYVKIYENFITPSPPSQITSKVIVENSKRIETSGKFEKAYLYVVAKVDKKDTDNQKLTKGESVYFYIDTGEKGGHLIKSKTIKLDEEKINNTVSNFVYKISNIELTSIPYRDISTPIFKKVDLLEILNSENGGYYRKHYLGAFVSSNLGKGELIELGIAYKCKSGYKCLIRDITSQ